MRKNLCLATALLASCFVTLQSDASHRRGGWGFGFGSPRFSFSYGRSAWGGYRWGGLRLGGWGYRGIGYGLGNRYGYGWRGGYGRSFSPYYSGYYSPFRYRNWGSYYGSCASSYGHYYRVAPVPTYYAPAQYTQPYCVQTEIVPDDGVLLATKPIPGSREVVSGKSSLLLKLARDISPAPAPNQDVPGFSAVTRFAYNPETGVTPGQPSHNTIDTRIAASKN